METEVVKCDHCDELSEDIHKEVGWITFRNFIVSISGGRESGVEEANTLRYFNNNNVTHFCSLWCLISHLYRENNHFNSDIIHNIEEFFKHRNVDSGDKDAITNMYKEIEACLEK